MSLLMHVLLKFKTDVNFYLFNNRDSGGISKQKHIIATALWICIQSEVYRLLVKKILSFKTNVFFMH